MKSLVHPEFLQRIDAKEIGRIEGLKLITDLPLELLPSNGIPLALRFDTSRISPCQEICSGRLATFPLPTFRQAPSITF